ncbi:iron-containing alcohol dehydrogenase [Magnetovibrio sp.]|uniref:iron-containing alcohol dehydrogenase n=1 Tax=Magnetovibrio sp. TaxID=2024836 RepID=UPI002F9453CD
MPETFSIARLPKIIFGAGTLSQLPDEISRFGTKVLLVTGDKSFLASQAWVELQSQLDRHAIAFDVIPVRDEPSPELVDAAVRDHADGGFDVVVGIGGGSAVDAAKAIAGLLIPANSVMDHLEGVGPELPYRGPATPLICVPTTAGTGSEATKNAVLSRHGADGFKKSFRDDALVAVSAIVDPDLLTTCPKSVIAANGMDAFTQLLESLTSTRSNAMTAALAWSGLERFAQGFWDMWLLEGETGPRAQEARTHMAYASLMSGICLAQTGLGSVHGLAQPLGSLFPIPHGVVCGTLVAEATDINIRALIERAPSSPALSVYARAGALMLSDNLRGNDALDGLVRTLRDWTERLELPRLGTFGVGDGDVDRIVANSRGSSMQTNPVVLSDGEIAELVQRRI